MKRFPTWTIPLVFASGLALESASVLLFVTTWQTIPPQFSTIYTVLDAAGGILVLVAFVIVIAWAFWRARERESAGAGGSSS